MLLIRKVTGKDIRSTFTWLSKDPPFTSNTDGMKKVRLLTLFDRNLLKLPSKQRQVKIGD